MEKRHEVAIALQNFAGPIFVTSHNNPDGDAIGSLLGLTWALKKLGKEVTPVLLDPIPDNLRFLPGSEEICNPLDLPVPLEGLLVSVDVSGRTRMNVPLEWNLPMVIIDHHVSGKLAEGLLWSKPEATATAEMIEELVREEWGLSLSKDAATCLYLGIATDSGFFKYSNTTARILRIAANLIEAGVDPSFISENFEIRSLHTLHRLGDSLETIELFWDGWLAEMTILKREDDPPGFSEGFVDFPRSIPSAQVAALYKEVDVDTVRVSLRSKGPNVAKVAEFLGGGGHVRAAGLTFTGTLEEAKERVREALSRYREER